MPRAVAAAPGRFAMCLATVLDTARLGKYARQPMDYKVMLRRAARRHGQARKRLREAEAERDHAIRGAHTHGNMTIREIAELAEMSHQRVAQIVKARRQ